MLKYQNPLTFHMVCILNNAGLGLLLVCMLALKILFWFQDRYTLNICLCVDWSDNSVFVCLNTEK